MIDAESRANRGAFGRRMHIWLWMAAVAYTAMTTGCATARDQRSTMMPVRPAVHHQAIITSATNEPVRSAAALELGPKIASEIPQIERRAPQPVDPGAAALVNAMLNGMGERIVGPDDVTRIGLCRLRNQSRAPAAEFENFCTRLADLLNHAASKETSARLEFTGDPNQAVQYQMQGTAYIVSAGGFDLWEMFLSLTPATKDWTIWEGRHPVRVLRQPRPGQPQFVAW